MAELPKIVQEGNNYRLGSQLFSSQSAAQAGLNRLMSLQKTPTTSTNPVLPTQTITPPVAPTPTAPVAPTTTVLPISKESEVYKQLTAKGYDDAKILDLYNQAKAKKTPEEQARITKQEPVKKSIAVDPMAEPATPAVNVNVNNEPAKPVQPPKTDKGPLTPLALSEYQDNSTVRQNEIVNNLNGYRQSNPEYLTNLDTFRKTFSYGLRSDDQKQLLDNWYLGYQKGVELGIMGTNAIVDQYGSGNITSSDLEQLRLNNPSKYQEVMDAINKKDIVRTYQNELYETDEQKTIMAQLDEADGQGSIFEEYKNTINSDEVKALQTEIQDMETQREQLSLELNDIKDQVEKRYEGTGATKGKIAYIVAKESAALQKQITSLGIDSANRVDKYNSIVNTAKETMQLQLQEQEAERAARNQKMSELGFYYEYDPVGMAERAENIFNIENPDINSSDANTARRALNNELTKYYEKYGDIIIRPQSQALNDIIAQAKTDGTSLSAALKKNFTDQLQSKSLYGATLGKNLGIDMGSYNMTQSKDGNWNISEKSASYGGGSISGGYNSNASWTGNTITNMGSATDAGVDYDVNVGDEIQAPVGGTLSLQQDSKTGNVYAKITQANGDTVQINHLDQSTLTKLSSLNGTQISAGDIIGYGGNSGNVKDINGNWLRKDGKVLNQQALNSGIGSHLDVRVNTGGKQLYGQDLVNYLNGTSTNGDGDLTERANLLKSTMSKQARDSFDEALKATGGNTQLMENLIKDMEIDKYYDRIKDPLNDYQKSELPLKEINNAFSRIDAVWQSYKADPKSITSKNALDQVLVIGLNKILDPGSVVRESEFARAPEGMSFFNKREGKIAKIQEGGVGLTDSERTEIINAVTLMKQGQQGAINQYKDDLLLAGKTLNVPEQFIYGLIGGESKFNVGGTTPQQSSGTSTQFGFLNGGNNITSSRQDDIDDLVN